MRYYSNKYEMPVWNWFMYQIEGFDLRYFLKKPKLNRKLTKKQTKKLNGIYMKILYSLENIDSKVLENYILWKSLLTQLKVNILRCTDKKMDEMETVFRKYLDSVQDNYTDFDVIEFSFNPDYENLFKNRYKEHLPERTYNLVQGNLIKLKDIRFYTWDEYFIFINQYPEMLVLTTNEHFKDEFILENKIKINNIIELDTYLSDIYAENGIYNDYQFVRAKLFDINKLNSKSKTENNPFKDYAKLCTYLNISYNDKIPLSAYESYLEQAHNKAETEKPKADGGR